MLSIVLRVSNLRPHLKMRQSLNLALWGAMLVASVAQARASTAAFNWTFKTDRGPAPRGYAAMAYDAAEERVILFGGIGMGGPLSDTWSWDGSKWVKQHPKTVPPARYGAGMAYDAIDERVVMFGGDVGPFHGELKQLTDTWVWDGTDWTEEHPATVPPGLENPKLDFYAADRKVVMYGVTPGKKGLIPETWVWDGTDWIEQHPVTSPPAFADYSMASDTAKDNVVLCGGIQTGGELSPLIYSTWVWNGDNWAKEPEGSVPEKADHSLAVSMAYDADNGTVVMTTQDGVHNIGFSFLTWEWNGKNWTLEHPKSGPTGLHGEAMIYDSAHKVVVLFGGDSSAFYAPLGLTWVWGQP